MASEYSPCYTRRMRPSVTALGTAIALALALTAPTCPSAQSRSVYGAGLDEGAAMVRLVNAGAPGPARLSVGAVELSAKKPGDASPYRPAVPDIYMLGEGKAAVEFLPEPGGWYTIAAGPLGLAVFQDERHRDPAKAQLYLYNLTKAPVELKTADGKAKALGPVQPGSSGQVAVNAVKIALAAFSPGGKLGTDLALTLERGASYSVFAGEGPGGPVSFAVKASAASE